LEIKEHDGVLTELNNGNQSELIKELSVDNGKFYANDQKLGCDVAAAPVGAAPPPPPPPKKRRMENCTNTSQCASGLKCLRCGIPGQTQNKLRCLSSGECRSLSYDAYCGAIHKGANGKAYLAKKTNNACDCKKACKDVNKWCRNGSSPNGGCIAKWHYMTSGSDAGMCYGKSYTSQFDINYSSVAGGV
jgi:hypothetical protein